METIRLTDEELRQIANNNTELDSFDWDDVIKLMGLSNKAQLKKVVEYIDKNFYIGVDCGGEVVYEGDYKRWQSLLEEVRE